MVPASASFCGSPWQGSTAPITRPGTAIWQSRATTAELMPPLRPTTTPRAPAAVTRWRIHRASSLARRLMSGHRGGRRRRRAIDDPQEGVDERRIELPRSLTIDLGNRLADGPGGLVRPLLGERIEDVDDRHDPSRERYRVAGDARVAEP